MDADKANTLRLEIWRELMRRAPQRDYGQITVGGSLGPQYQYDPVVAARLTGTIFTELYPPSVTITTTAGKPRRKRK